MQIKWTDFAQTDLDRVEAYISKAHSASMALDVVFNVLDCVELMLPMHPESGRLGRLEGTRELVIKGVPFIVIYRIAVLENAEAKKEIQILRVMHDAQQWPQDN